MLKTNCCQVFNIDLWVNKADLLEQQLSKLEGDFDKNDENYTSELRIDENKEDSSLETDKKCDALIQDLFEDSNNVNISYDDFDWFMRSLSSILYAET